MGNKKRNKAIRWIRNNVFQVVLGVVALWVLIGVSSEIFSWPFKSGLKIIALSAFIFGCFGIFAFIDDKIGQKCQKWLEGWEGKGETKDGQ